MSPTLSQLRLGIRCNPVRKSRVPAFNGAPNRRGVVYKIAVMSPRKPNSARRTIAKVKIPTSGFRLFAKIPGIGAHFLQPHSVVFVRGQGPKDSPGVNYYLVRGRYDFSRLELYGRRQKRSKFGVSKFK